jgi:hypothetical protein
MAPFCEGFTHACAAVARRMSRSASPRAIDRVFLTITPHECLIESDEILEHSDE